MVTIAEKSKSDSRMMAVATLIATIYLPASFVAVRLPPSLSAP